MWPVETPPLALTNSNILETFLVVDADDNVDDEADDVESLSLYFAMR